MTRSKKSSLLILKKPILPVLVILLVIAPLLDTYGRHILIFCILFSIVALGWNLITGYTGLLSLGTSAFFGIGAYISALAGVYLGIPPFLGLFIGGLASCFIGFLLGLTSIRLGGAYLAIVTLGFSQIVLSVIRNAVEITGGPMGLVVAPMFVVPDIAAFKLVYFYFILAAFLVLMYTVSRLLDSPMGTIFRCLRDNEIAAESIGVDTLRYKLIAFSLSSLVIGIGGALYGHYILIISPEAAGVGITFEVLAMTILGGIGTLWGPMVGAFTLTFLGEALRVTTPEIRLMTYGLLIMVIIMFIPAGLSSLLKRRISSARS
ncbi:MAG: branched-chain amino acid ABC transporter permease [Candidatus Hodarchaeota archaeon]